MIVLVDVLLEHGEPRRPPLGTPVEVRLLDTSLADADARVLAVATGRVDGASSSWLTTVELVADDDSYDARADITVAARLMRSPDEGPSRGDWITTQSVTVPVAPGEHRVSAPVRGI